MANTKNNFFSNFLTTTYTVIFQDVTWLLRAGTDYDGGYHNNNSYSLAVMATVLPT